MEYVGILRVIVCIVFFILGLSRSYVQGVTYVRWGRRVCKPEVDAKVVYTGFMAGKNEQSTGSGANYICLTDDPELYHDRLVDDNKWYGTLYGVELEAEWPFSDENAYGPLWNNDLPCVVCEVAERSQMLMIPGRYKCPKGWKREYRGFLSSNSQDDPTPTEYICLDEAPEGIHGGDNNHNQAGITYVRAECGSLPCPPYQDNREVACVVCTK